MSATDELLRMLTEAGVEYRFNDATKVFEWHFDGTDGEGSAHATEVHGGINIIACSITPEQAIDATVGPATCHLEEIEKDCDTASEYMLDRECCFDAVYRCSCGCRFGHVAHNRPRFCPNCGAKAVGE